MVGEFKEKSCKAAASVTLILSAMFLSGCAYSLGDFGLERPQRGSVAVSTPAETANPGAPIQPAALVEADPLPSAQSTPAAEAANSLPGATATGLFPTGKADAKLLTPEEKAAVIAELEALARSQKVVPPGPQRVVCDDQSLAPVERLRRENEGIAC